MHEYEFRLAVQRSTSFLPLMSALGSIQKEYILYAEPHFRYRNNWWEVKRVINSKMVYHDGLWFKWVHSKEIPFKLWKRSTCKTFMDINVNFQNPYKTEDRDVIILDKFAKIYTFQSSINTYRLVFEMEYGTFPTKKTCINYTLLLKKLSRYRYVYEKMAMFESPSYVLKENIFRKPVKRIEEFPKDSTEYLYAHKADGIFGQVYSYSGKIIEKWEDYKRVVRQGISLGDGFVFAAEKLEDGHVILLDVYQVRSVDTASWCRKSILMKFLSSLKLPDGYSIQIYSPNLINLCNKPSWKTDGYIIHDVVKDELFKKKMYNSIDLIYYKGYFWMQDKRIPCSKSLKDGCVYEICTVDGSVIRERPDRFKGNTVEQLKLELRNGWGGPKFENIPSTTMGKSKRRKQNII